MSQRNQIEVQTYTKIGTGRPSPTGEYQPTITYKGRLKNSINYIAIKSIDIKRQDDAYNLYNFLKDQNHPHILKIYHWYKTANHFWYYIEYCPGGTLLDLLEQDVRLPESIIKIFAVDILDALFYLHTNGVILKDMQPRNILINECGSLKIADFTRAESIDKPQSLNVIVDEDMIEYLAPELLLENGIGSFASDLYSFGALLYRMAAGQVPFKSSLARDPESALFHEAPPLLPGYSNDFNDLVQALLRKNPATRPQWAEVIKHPFWEDLLTNRPKSSSPTEFDVSRLPKNPTREQNRLAGNLTRRASAVAIPAKGVESARISTQSSPKTIESMIMTSELFEPQQLFLNTTIDTVNIPSFKPEELDLKFDINSSIKTEVINVFEQCLNNIRDETPTSKKDRRKYGYIAYLIQKIQNDFVADTIAETPLFSEILKMALELKSASASGLLILYGGIAHNAHNISPSNLSEEALKPLKILAEKEEKVSRKAISAFGEIAFYMASAKTPLVFPSFFEQIIMTNLQNNKDEIMQHYVYHIVSGIVPLPKCSSLFDIKKVEELMMKCNNFPPERPAMLERYAIALCEIYQQIETSNKEHVEDIIIRLMSMGGNSSNTCRQLSLMLASSAKMLYVLKDELGKCLADTFENIKMKALLSVCLCFGDDLKNFLGLSSRFLFVLDKFAQDNWNEVDAVSNWFAQIAWKIIKGNDYSLFQIITPALIVKVCREKMWTNSFQKTFGEKLLQMDFTNPDAVYALQVLEAAVHEGVCSFELVTYISKAFESPEKDTRFLSLKIVADLNSNASKNNTELASFVLEKVLPLAPTILNNSKQSEDDLISEQVLKILSFTANNDKNCVPVIAKKEIYPRVFEKMCQSPSALLLTYHIIQFSGDIIDNFVESGLLEAISDAVKKENIPDSFDVLYAILNPLTKQLTSSPNSQQVLSVISKISKLAELTKICAERLFLGTTKILNCLQVEIYIFSYLPNAIRCPFEDAFPALACRIKEAKFSQEHANVAKRFIEMLFYVSTKSTQTELVKQAMRNCSDFMNALFEASESPIIELSNPSKSLLQIINA